ncbi:hypothetical protein RQP46_005213 [Phenoliferia psychrophenolica]
MSTVYHDEANPVPSNPADAEMHVDQKHALDFADENKGVDVTEVREAAEHLTLEDAKRIIHDAIDGRETDPNFDQGLLKRANAALNAEALSHDVALGLVEEIKLEAALMDDSPYVEVRASVSNTDDHTLPINTFRAWFIGLAFTLVGSGINVFFSARNPGIVVNTFCAQVLSYPFGMLFAWALPTKSWTMFGHRCSLNPGPFNIKEHMLITIMANVTFGGVTGVYSTDIIFVQRLPQFFNQNAVGGNAGYQIMLTLSTQLIGFCMAGFSRRFLVYPPAMIWPANLATIVLNRSFHQDTNPIAHGWKISRLRFFTYVFFGYGMYFVLPDCIMGFLTYFNWMTWISPQNVKLAIFTGSISGLGINPITTFDWSYLSALNNPLVTPLFSTLNLYAGAVIIGLIMIPAIYFTNTWNTGYLPINSNHLFDNTGGRFNVSKVLNPDFTLNVQKFEGYSEAYQSAGNAVVFFAFFAVYTATLMHIILYYRPEVINGFRAVMQRKNPRDAYHDVHNRLMRRYKEVPEWWFGIVLVISLALGIAANEHYHTGIFFCVIMGGIFVVPVGIIVAITNIEITLNVIAEVIGGYTLPGRPLAVMIFKTYGFISTAQAVGYAADMKLGHYVKIPPRTMFTAQLIASILACFAGLGVADWQIVNIKGICGSAQINNFTCPGYNTFFNSAVQWGAIGPARLYSEGKIYYPLVFGFLFGAVFPIPIYFLTRKFPNSYWKYVNTPAFIYGALNWAPYNLSYLTPGIPIAIYFQGYLRRNRLAWWTKYNYILASALTAAVSIFGVIWFFAILYKNYAPIWWGNYISYGGPDQDGCDANGCPWLAIPDKGCFGPAPACPAGGLA